MSVGSTKPRGFVRGEVGACPDDPERAIGASGQAVGTRREVERARQQPAPGRGRPAEGDGEQDDVVGPVVVALDVEVAGRLRGRGEDLERDVPLAQARDVHLATVAALQQVAAPQQRIGVEIGDPQRLVQRPRAIRRPYGGAAQVRHRRASVRPTIARPPAFAPSVTAVAASRAETDGRRAARRAHEGTGRTGLRRPDLVEERERARVAFERPADELAEGGLGLAFDVGREAERRDRLDVEPLVGLEQLERLEADRRPVVRRTGTPLAQDPAERRHPAEALVRLEDPVAFDAAVHLRPLAELVEEVHLVPARDPSGRHLRVEQLVRPAEQGVQRLGGVALLERPVGELGEVPGRRRRFERVAQVEPGVSDPDLGHDVERPAAGQADVELRERLEAAAEPRRRAADALGDGLQLAPGRGDQRQDPVGLAEVEPREDDGVGRVAARDGHRVDGTTAVGRK